MNQIKPLNEILEIQNCDELVSAFYFHIVEKKRAARELSQVEEVVYLLVSMLPDIEMEGFIDLFHQLYSLKECVVVEESLRQFNLSNLANLFGEAKSIYVNGKANITEEEYRQLGVLIADDSRSRRFDEIGDMIIAEGSEIYHLSDVLCMYIRSNREALLRNDIQ